MRTSLPDRPALMPDAPDFSLGDAFQALAATPFDALDQAVHLRRVDRPLSPSWCCHCGHANEPFESRCCACGRFAVVDTRAMMRRRQAAAAVRSSGPDPFRGPFAGSEHYCTLCQMEGPCTDCVRDGRWR